MVDTVKNKELALEMGRLIDMHKGEDTVVIDVSEQSSWTEYFIISTVNSLGHLKGVVKHIKHHLREKNIPVFHRHKRVTENGWELIDCGFVVIHLMDGEMRDFYDLEKLWFNGDVVYQSGSEQTSAEPESGPEFQSESRSESEKSS